MEDYVMQLPAAEEMSKSVEKIVNKVGIKGLDTEKAEKLGLYERIGNLISLMSVTAAVADRIYGSIDSIISSLGFKKHEIKQNCAAYEKAFDTFMNFWIREGYFSREAIADINTDVEELYHMVMRWGLLPEKWNLGDEQKLSQDTDTLIKVDLGDRFLKFRRSVAKEETIEEPVEEWCVTEVFREDSRQFVVYRNMSKADAMVIAKRMSAENPDSIYTASLMTTFTEKRMETMPMKVFMNNEQVGSIKSFFKE